MDQKGKTAWMRRAEEMQDENWTFRGWLKHRCDLDDRELMGIVRRLAEEVNGNLCRVYEARPTVRCEYPHLHNDFRQHSVARMADSFVCPIVFDVIEGMKLELHWRYGRR